MSGNLTDLYAVALREISRPGSLIHNLCDSREECLVWAKRYPTWKLIGIGRLVSVDAEKSQMSGDPDTTKTEDFNGEKWVLLSDYIKLGNNLRGQMRLLTAETGSAESQALQEQLDRLLEAGKAMAVGIGVHNDRCPDQWRVEGPVVTAFVKALHNPYPKARPPMTRPDWCAPDWCSNEMWSEAIYAAEDAPIDDELFWKAVPVIARALVTVDASAEKRGAEKERERAAVIAETLIPLGKLKSQIVAHCTGGTIAAAIRNPAGE